jgi:hypothetical protein
MEVILILIGITVIFIVLIGSLSYGFVSAIKKELNKFEKLISSLIMLLYLGALTIFLIGLRGNMEQYQIAIDPIDSGYSPFSKNHVFTFITVLILSLIGIYNIWKNGKKSPPLLTVLYLSFLTIGIIACTLLLFQLSSRDNNDSYIDESTGHFMMLAPFMHISLSVMLIIKVIREESIISNERAFQNKFLNLLNQKLKRSSLLSFWSLLVLLPFYFFLALILILLGQEFNSLTKVFTETSTWYLSEKTHPPYLDHRGHYLCTVAVCGNPKIVKPLRIGHRHGEEIIVNRQLLIANAFEGVITKKFPKLHRVIRTNYDKYGYPLSKKITSKKGSNLTYILMKPIEWVFLITIYLTCEKPEKLINEQYRELKV